MFNGDMQQAPTLTNWLHLLTLGVIWGGTFMFISIALRDYGPITVACARTTLGALSLLILMRIFGAKPPTREAIPSLIKIGLFSTAIPFMLLSWGLTHVPSSFAGISMASVPLFVLPLAHIFSDEPMDTRGVIGMLMGFIGIVVLIGPTALNIGQGVVLFGQIACFGAALCYAISSINSRNCPPTDPMTIGAVSLMVGAVVMVPLMLYFEGIPKVESPGPTVAIILLGLLPTAFATYLRILIIRSAGSVFMTLVNFQVPLWSVFFGAILLAEPVPSSLFAALVLILSGLVISQFSNLKRIFNRL